MHAILVAVTERLKSSDESLIRIPEICLATGVNYGSVYHHFGSREGVIDAAYEMMFMTMVEEDIDVIRSIDLSANTIDEFINALQPILLRLSADSDRRERRSQRARIVAASLTRPELRTLIGAAQAHLTDELSHVVKFGQDRGWIRTEISAHALAVMMQAIVIGRTIDDISLTPIPQAEWDGLFHVIFANVLDLSDAPHDIERVLD